MSNMKTTWRVQVVADTARARTELSALAKTANRTGLSMEQAFAGVNTQNVGRDLGNIGRQLDKMNVAVNRGKVGFGQLSNYWRNSGNLVRYSKQLSGANAVIQDMTDGSIRATLSMQKFGTIAASTGERLAYMNTFLQSATTNMINAAKNMQWAGRQITVGFGVPFGLAMTGASMAFLDFEQQVVRFRKVYDEEMGGIPVDIAEQRITRLANTMARELGVVRNEVLETSAVFAQMGYSVEEIERLTKATTELAMLGEVDPLQATDLLRAYSASGFADQYKEAEGTIDGFEERVKNMLNAIENSTGLTLAQMAENMAQLIPLFSQFKLEMGEGESILAGMTEALGGRANEAVTALKAIMQRVNSESKQTRENFAEIGIDINALQETYKDDVIGLLTALGNELQNNQAVLESNVTAADTFGKLFGIRQVNRAIAAVNVLADEMNNGSEIANDYGRALEVINDHAGNAARAEQELAAQAESLGGRLRRLKEDVLIAVTEIGQTFLEMAMPFLEYVAGMVSGFNNLSESTKKFWIGMGAAITGLGLVLSTLGVLRQVAGYSIKLFSSFFPMLKSTTEESTKTRIAQDYYNQSLKKFREVAINADKGLVDLNLIMNKTETQTDNMTSSMKRVSLALQDYVADTTMATLKTEQLQAAMAGKTTGGMIGPQMPMYGPGREVWDKPVGRDGRRLGGAALASHMSKRQENIKQARAVSEQRRHERMMAGRRERAASYRRNFGARSPQRSGITGRTGHSMAGMAMRRNAGRTGSSMNWRGGAARAGGALMLGGMVAPGGAGNALMAAGAMSEIAALTPSITKGMTRMSTALATSAMKSTGLAAGLKGGMSSMLSLAAAGPVAAAVIAGIAGSAYLIWRNVKNAQEEAALLRTEFEVAAGVADDLGMSLDAVDDGFNLGFSREDSEEFDGYSESMKALIRSVEDAQNSGGNVQSIFRNVAREWLAGGATIEEINEKLDELEAIVQVEIDPVSAQELTSKLSNDLVESMKNALLGFSAEDRFWEIFTDREFSAQDEQRIYNVADSMVKASKTNPESLSPMLREFALEVEELSPTNDVRVDIYKRLMDQLQFISGLPEEIAAQAETAGELLALVAYRQVEAKQERGERLTIDELERMKTLLDSLPDTPIVRKRDLDAIEKMKENIGAMNMELAAVGMHMPDFEIVDISQVKNLEDAEENLSSIENNIRRVLANEGIRWDVTKTTMENLQRAAAMNPDLAEELQIDKLILGLREAIRLKMMFNGLKPPSEQELDLRIRREQIRQGVLDARSAGEKIAEGAEEGLDEGGDGIEEAGEDAAKRYIDGFRSELDRKRSEIIDAVLESYDEQTDAIIEGIEEQKDAEVESLEERKEAIDDYLEKQREINEAMQGQIDLAVALAKGERGKAAQIQNSMRFGDVEDMANDMKDAIDEEIETVNESYDHRVEREKELRDEKRKTLEEELEALEDIFIGTEEGWNNFMSQVDSTAKRFDTAINSNLWNGFDEAMDKIVRDARIDHMWDNTDFSTLRNRLVPFLTEAIRGATEDGITDGGLAGADNVVRALDAYIQDYIKLLDAGGGATTAQDENNLINLLTGQVSANGGTIDDTSGKLPSDFTDWEPSAKFKEANFHTGGQVGGGPPRDVPAVLQTGEFVIQRSAAQSLGPEVLSMLNNYHSGGFVGLGSMFGAGAMLPAVMSILQNSGMSGTPGSGGFDVNSLGKLGEEDSDSTWRYSNWKVNMQPHVIESFSKALADLPGSQIITSAYRSPAENRAVGGAPNSDHTKGKGVDFKSASNNSIAALNAMGSYFQGRQGVRWVGMPKTDPGGGHNDHVHVSYYHNGGLVGRGGGKRVQVPKVKTPKASNFSMNSSGLTIQIGEFHGTDSNIDLLVSRVGDALDRHDRKVNPKRRFG